MVAGLQPLRRFSGSESGESEKIHTTVNLNKRMLNDMLKASGYAVHSMLLHSLSIC